jgi:SAM-dependent methyltransferase
MKAKRDFEAFANTINGLDDRLSFPNMDRCMSIGIMGGCELRCAAFCDGECTEPYEFSTTDIHAEFHGEELQEILSYYPKFNAKGDSQSPDHKIMNTQENSARDFVDVHRLVLPLPPVLDACCGPKGMWFDKQNPYAIYMDRRRETHVDTYPCGTKTNVIDPCVVADFSAMPFPDESFRLVVFDPPHIEQTGTSQITKKYGSLQGDWREMLRAGFAECFRVLKPEGVLIFKWNDCRFPVRDILKLTPEKPLFGHKSGKKMGTHWVTFIKQNANDNQQVPLSDSSAG